MGPFRQLWAGGNGGPGQDWPEGMRFFLVPGTLGTRDAEA